MSQTFVCGHHRYVWVIGRQTDLLTLHTATMHTGGMQTTQGIHNPLGLDLIDATGYTTGQYDLDDQHVTEIADSMRNNGWQGAPLVVLPDYARAYSGTHRLAAATEAELDEVPAVTLVSIFEAVGLDLDEIAAADGLSVLDDRAEILAHLPEATLAAYGLDDIC